MNVHKEKPKTKKYIISDLVWVHCDSWCALYDSGVLLIGVPGWLPIAKVLEMLVGLRIRSFSTMEILDSWAVDYRSGIPLELKEIPEEARV